MHYVIKLVYHVIKVVHYKGNKVSFGTHIMSLLDVQPDSWRGRLLWYQLQQGGVFRVQSVQRTGSVPGLPLDLSPPLAWRLSQLEDVDLAS